MQLSKNTSIGRRSKVLNVSIKVAIVSFIIFLSFLDVSGKERDQVINEIQKII